MLLSAAIKGIVHDFLEEQHASRCCMHACGNFSEYLHISNNRRSSGVEVRYDSNISPLDKHTGVFPMSKRAVGRRLYCVVHRDILPGLIACGIVFFVLAPKALASAQLVLPDTLPCCHATPVSSELNPKLWLLAFAFHSVPARPLAEGCQSLGSCFKAKSNPSFSKKPSLKTQPRVPAFTTPLFSWF